MTDLTYHFRRLVFAQVVLGIIAFCLAEANPGLLLIAGAIAGLSWYVAEGPGGRPIPSWAVNLGALPAVAWMVLDIVHRDGQVIIPVGHFTMCLQVLMLYARKTNREYALLLVLSLLQMVGASVLSVSMVYGLLLGAYCVLALMTLLVFQLKSSRDRVQEHNRRAAPRSVLVAPPSSVVGRGHRWHFRGSAVVIGLVCLATAVAVFVIVPRRATDRTGRVGEQALTSTKKAGFRDRVDLGGAPPTRGNREPILNMSVERDGQPIGENNRVFLLRGAALDRYDARQRAWVRGPRLSSRDRSIDVTPEGIVLAKMPEQTPMLEAQVTLRQSSYRNLFTVFPTTTLASDNAAQLLMNPVDQQLTTQNNINGAVVYTIRWPVSRVPDLTQRYQQQIGAGNLSDFYDMRDWFSRRRGGEGDDGGDDDDEGREEDRDPAGVARGWPTGYARGWSVQHDRVVGYARGLLRQAGVAAPPPEASPAPDAEGRVAPGSSGGETGRPDWPRPWRYRAHQPPDDTPIPANARQIVRALSEHLRTNFTYTLDNPELGRGEDPVVNFLLTRRRGHCELFAAGLAAMCRSLGIPARVVTGYRAAEYNSIGGYYVVRESNAHAWTEVYLGDDVGWATVDATPPGPVRAEHRVDAGMFSSVRQVYDYFEFIWIKSVVAYDQSTRAALLKEIRGSVSQSANHPGWGARAMRFIRELPQLWRLDRVGYTLAGLVLVLLGLALFSLARILLGRRRRLMALQLHALPRRQRQGLSRKLRFYLTMLEMLDRHGYVRPEWQSPFGFAQELAEANPMKFDPVIALTEVFYEVRFGYRELDEGRRGRIRAHLKQLETALAQTHV